MTGKDKAWPAGCKKDPRIFANEGPSGPVRLSQKFKP
jgi:hypothetical protein